jgi:PAS domain S-box-containing protein
MRRKNLSRKEVLTSYLKACLVVAVGLWIETWFPAFNHEIAYLALLPLIFLTARVWGFGPAVLAGLLGGMLADYWVIGDWSDGALIHREGFPGFLVFFCATAVISWLVNRWTLLEGQLFNTMMELQNTERDRLRLLEDARLARRTAERERHRIEKSEKEFRAFFELSTVGAQQVNAQSFKFIRVNQKLCEITGYTERELMSMKCIELTHPDDRGAELEGFETVKAGHRDDWKSEKRNIRKDGRVIWTMVNGTMVRDDAGRPLYCIATVQDITAMKVAEQELQVARQVAESANKAKSEFLANMSHEIRTPLGAVLGFADLLRDHSISESQRSEFINIIYRNGSELVGLVDDILDLSKIEAGKLEVERRTFVLPALISGVIALFDIKAREKGLALTFESDSTVPEKVVSDQTRLRQILINIIGNAIKFTEKGSVHVQLRWNSKPRGVLEVTVTDTGPGISIEQREKLFCPFSQADSAVSRKYGGSGLGLVLSRRLARALGGDLVLAESTPGHGSRFVITVETGNEESAQAAGGGNNAPVADLPRSVRRSERLRGCRILVAEDSVDNQYLISRLLTMHGAEVQVVDNGRAAVEAAAKSEYNLVLMDIQMPVLDGCSATREIRELGIKVPVIALTAHALREERAKTEAAGCDDHLTKPIESSALIETIERHTRPALAAGLNLKISQAHS